MLLYTQDLLLGEIMSATFMNILAARLLQDNKVEVVISFEGTGKFTVTVPITTEEEFNSILTENEKQFDFSTEVNHLEIKPNNV